MNACRNLGKLYSAARRRMGFLRLVSLDPAIYYDSRLMESHISFVTIELLNCWANFLRAYYLSVMRTTKTQRGYPVRPNSQPVGQNEALGRAILRFRPQASARTDGSWRRRDEPRWHDRDIFIKLCRDEGFSNLTDILAAFSAGTTAFDDLRILRNYFAHRNQDAEGLATRRAISYGISPKMRPAQFLISRAPGRPQTVLQDWLSDLMNTANLLCH